MSDDMLSQDEINALLKGDNFNKDEELTEEQEIKEAISGEIPLENIPKEEEPEEIPSGKYHIPNEYEGILTEMELDALGEVGNISMGTAATTLSTLLNKKVNITTPTVSITDAHSLSEEYVSPLVAIDVSYSEGLEGTNIMILKTDDVKIITDLMMGNEEINTDRELTELDLSAVSEAMNQMMGSSATSISSMLNTKIDIKPPVAKVIDFVDDEKTIEMLIEKGPLVKISFKMEIGEYIDSNIMQLIPAEFGKNMVSVLMGGGEPVNEDASIVEEAKEVNYSNEGTVDEVLVDSTQNNKGDIASQQQHIQQPLEQSQQNMGQTQFNSGAPIMSNQQHEKVAVSPPNFPSFDNNVRVSSGSEIDLVGDIPVEITVELGRTNKKIGEILEFGMGTIIELDKLVGEPLKVLANGKYIASGEVVVIDDNFGVRIKEIETNKKII